MRSIRLATVAAACALVGACGYDFGKFASPAAESESDSATGGDGSMPVDSGGGDTSMPSEVGTDTSMSADVAIDTSSGADVVAQDAPEAAVTDFTVGGTLSGLVGQGLQLTNSGNMVSPASGDTAFTFPAQPDGSAYAVAVATQPSMPAQTCAVMNGSGTIAGANVTTVQIACTPACAPLCKDGQQCVDGTDCASGSCQGGNCRPPACAPTCADGNVCGGNGDCGSRTCSMSGMCRPPACAPGCNDGNDCGANGDCGSLVCMSGKCHAPACAPTCMTGSPCGAGGDCVSGMCRPNHTCK
jgi:hypothetical protein